MIILPLAVTTSDATKTAMPHGWSRNEPRCWSARVAKLARRLRGAYVTSQVTDRGDGMRALRAQHEEDKPVLLPVGQELLRDALRAGGKTVTALAAELGISRKHLSNVLNGRAPLLEPLLGRLAQAAGVDPGLLGVTVRRRPARPPARYGAMRGTVAILADPTEPMEHWEMLED